MHYDGYYQPQQQPDGLVAGSLDLVTMLLKASYIWQDGFFYFPFAIGFPSFQNLCGIINLYHNSIHNLLTTLCDSILQNAPIDVVKAVHDVCFDAVIWIVLHSNNHCEMQVI